MARPAWLPSLFFVLCLHLLTTAGVWYVTDHGEILYAARRLLHEGTLDLTDPGQPRLPFMPNVRPLTPEGPVRSRFLPIPTLLLVPLLAVDEALGLGDPHTFGRLVHLQGHLCIAATLALVGWGVRRAGGDDRDAALAVLLCGTTWPVWLVSRRVGPEPVVLLTTAAFVVLQLDPLRRGARALGALLCFLLPWMHVTGPFVSAGLVLGVALRPFGSPLPSWRARAREAWPYALGTTLGTVSVVFLWNHLYHHNWLAGGYGLFDADTAFSARFAAAGLLRHLVEVIGLAAPLLVAALLRIRRTSERGRAVAASVAVSLTLVLSVLFATFFAPDPPRRLAVVVAAWALAVRAPRLGALRELPLLLGVGSTLLGVYWFFDTEGGWKWGPWGIGLPQYVLWVDLALAARPWWQWALPPALLVAGAGFAGQRTWRLLVR